MAAATAEAAHVTSPGRVRRMRMAAASVGAALLGAAPHVLHHAGPLAGAALFAGLGGTLLRERAAEAIRARSTNSAYGRSCSPATVTPPHRHIAAEVRLPRAQATTAGA